MNFNLLKILFILIALLFLVSTCNKKGSKDTENVKEEKQNILETDKASFNKKTGEFEADEYTIGLWHLNEEDNVIAFDDTSNELHGEVSNAQWAKGIFSNALLFSKNSILTIADSDKLLAPSNALTVELWIYILERQELHATLIKKYSGVPVHHTYRIWIQNEPYSHFPKYTIWASIINDNKYFSIPNYAPWKALSKQWRYIALTFNGTKFKSYTDGELQGIKGMDTTINKSTHSVEIGNQFRGMIDEIRISKVARSEKAIKTYWDTAKTFIDKSK